MIEFYFFSFSLGSIRSDQSKRLHNSYFTILSLYLKFFIPGSPESRGYQNQTTPVKAKPQNKLDQSYPKLKPSDNSSILCSSNIDSLAEALYISESVVELFTETWLCQYDYERIDEHSNGDVFFSYVAIYSSK